MKIIEAIIKWLIQLFGGYVRPGPGTWKGCLFVPHKIHGVGGTPIWPGNRGVDSLMGAAYDAVKNQPWQAAKRTNALKWTQAYGGDTAFYIAEPLFNNPALQEYFTSERGIVKEAREYGIKRWVAALFNDGALPPADIREAYIKQICECYNKWASKHEVAFLVGLETNETMTVAVVREIVGWIKKYAPGKRIIVGSASVSFLKACEGDDIELWKETDWFPFDTTIINAPNYLNQLSDLLSYGKIWAGEWGAGQAGEVDKFITEKAIALGCDCGSGFYK